MLTMMKKPGDYIEETRTRFATLTDKVLSLYPAGADDITKRSMADLYRDLTFGWPTYAWATLQSKTGRSPMFVYYFDQNQPASVLTSFLKSNRAFHGSDCLYAFGHLEMYEPIISARYTLEDKKLSEIIIEYWTNFVKSGNPNGKKLPEWPVFHEGKPSVMYLKSYPEAGTYPNIDKIKLIDEYFKLKRESPSK